MCCLFPLCMMSAIDEQNERVYYRKVYHAAHYGCRAVMIDETQKDKPLVFCGNKVPYGRAYCDKHLRLIRY